MNILNRLPLLCGLLFVSLDTRPAHAQPCIDLQCPADIVVECAGEKGTVVNFEVKASNRCGDGVTVTSVPPSGSLFPVGLTTVICTARGGRGEVARCAFTVEVQDNKPPGLECPRAVEVEAQGLDGAIVTWGVVASDDCDPEVTVLCEPPSGSLFPPGTTLVRCVATDDSGNQSFCGFEVTVRESRPLEIVPHGPMGVLLRWYVAGKPEMKSSLDPSEAWRPIDLPMEQTGHVRTMLYPVGRLGQVFFRIAALPLAEPADADGDGVPDRLDKCPGTEVGERVDACGCSALRLATRPELVAEEGLGRLGELLEDMTSYEAMMPTARAIEHEVGEMQGALEMIRAGQIEGAAAPGGVDRFGRAVVGLRMAQDQLRLDIAQMERALMANPPETHGYGDVTPEDAMIMAVQMMANKLEDALASVDVAEGALKGLKESIAGSGRHRGQVAAIQDSESHFELVDGLKIGLCVKDYGTVLSEGALVDVGVTQFKDGSVLAQDIGVVDAGSAFPDDVYVVKCLHLRIAPNQRFAPFNSGPYTFHYPTAYDHEGTLWLETGMRLGVISSGCSGLDASGSVIVYKMKLDLDYTSKNGYSKSVTLAQGLKSGQEPVPLPEDISPNVTAVLTAHILRQECSLLTYPDGCSAPQEMSVDTYNLRVRSRYSYATAIYSATVFDLEDSPNESSHRLAQVTSVSRNAGVLFDVPQINFEGEGYLATPNASTYPTLVNVGTGQNFAVFAQDLYNNDGILFKEPTLGVTNGSAIYWPRATGTYHGRKFAYACALPVLTRDAVSICNDLPHAFYRLPFKDGWPTWTISQGNFGSFTHNGWQAYAYDFPAPQNTSIRAARGGVVEDLRESFSISNWSPSQNKCVAFNHNYVVIRHQDGTTGNYLHMPLNGVMVSKGDKIYRGDIIAKVGTTGCSTGPHLHFDVRNKAGSLTIPSRFEAWNFCVVPEIPFIQACAPLKECYVPASEDILFSNNKRWWE